MLVDLSYGQASQMLRIHMVEVINRGKGEKKKSSATSFKLMIVHGGWRTREVFSLCVVFTADVPILRLRIHN